MDHDATPGRFDRFLEGSCHLFVAFFAAWTILCNVTVFIGSTFTLLIWLTPVGIVFATILFIYFRRRATEVSEPAGIRAIAEHGPKLTFWRKIVLLGTAELALVGYLLTGNYLLFWSVSLVFLIYAYVRYTRTGNDDEPVPPSQNMLLFSGAVVLIVAAALFSRATSLDESLFVNLSVGAIDNPDSPLLALDTIHGIAGLPVMLPTYKVHSIELLNAVIAHLTGLSVIVTKHVLLVPLYGLLAAVAIALLCREWLPRYWLPALYFVVLFLVLHGETRQTQGSFSFFSLYIGKHVFVTIMVPLAIWAAIRWSRSGAAADWILLFAVQIAAVGFTANALYAGPIASGLALAAYWQPTRSATRRLFIGLTASAYPVILALVLIATTGVVSSENSASLPTEDEFALSLGWGLARWFLLAALLGSWVFVENSAVRRMLIAIPVLCLLTIANPFLSDLWGKFVTGNLNWRLFWVLPIVPMSAIFVITGIQAVMRSRAANWGVVAILGVIALTWQHSNLSKSGVGWSLLKVPEPAYQFAREAAATAPREKAVLAPREIAAWIPTIENHPPLIVGRPLYLLHLQRMLSQDQMIQRSILFDYVDPEQRHDDGAGKPLHDFLVGTGHLKNGGPAIDAAEVLQQSLDSLNIGLVVIREDNRWRDEIEAVLSAADFSAKSRSPYVFWYAGESKKVVDRREAP